MSVINQLEYIFSRNIYCFCENKFCSRFTCENGCKDFIQIKKLNIDLTFFYTDTIDEPLRHIEILKTGILL